jgi:hypothetical protein
MESSQYPSRYLHIAGAFAFGGTTHQVDDVKAHVHFPAIAHAHLPLAGGRAESKAGKTSLNSGKADFGDVPRAKLAKLKATELVTLGSGYALAHSDPEVPGQPFGCRTISQIKALKMVGGLTLKHGLVTMISSHDTAKSAHPHITFGETVISGLKLGKSELKITLDIETFNKYPTLLGLEEAWSKDPKLRARLSNRFVTNGDKLHKTPSGYVIGSIVKSIEGLPKDAELLDAYTIFWPPIGRITLGEVFLAPQLRRVTLLRVKEACGEGGGGCVGGGSVP